MKILTVFAVLIAGFFTTADAAVPTQRRGAARAPAAGTSGTGTTTVAARAATRAPATSGTTAARSATGPRTVARGNTAPASSTTTAARSATVAARAGATQKVIGTGTKVAAATKNTVVSEACQQKYEGCMDSFCMLDNETGGRCICSDKNAEFDAILAEIEKLDQQSYQMATFGVERIEMGADADVAIANANAVAQSIVDADENKRDGSTTRTRKKLDLSLWDNSDIFAEDEDIFGDGDVNPIDGKEGDALHSAASDVCVASMPECASEMQMLKMMYAQRIRSDCTAYENSLKQQKNSSTQKLRAAEQALRSAALEQYQSANKYDLGQCTVEFKKCMITTGGCGDDFSGCASVVASDNTNVRQSTSRTTENYQIKGAISNIEISASTYDALMGKKPLCEFVTKQCTRVADQVWDTFLREVAPQLKSAELIAEDNARQNCIGNISECFQKACRDNIDPNDPDGSYDMCLTRPQTMLNLCKVPLNACGIDTANAESSEIWGFVQARLAGMRIDSCTTAVKECLQSDDRCGEGYTQCIGLDLNAVMDMCPADKLVGCMQDGQQKTMDELESMIQGILLNIDNSMIAECQNAVTKKMTEVCGSSYDCVAAFESDEQFGRGGISLQNKSRDAVDIIGLLDFGKLRTSLSATDGKMVDVLKAWTPEAGYNVGTDDFAKISQANAQAIVSKIRTVVDMVASDPTISMCVNGRDMSNIRSTTGDQDNKTNARFPNLLDNSVQMIVDSALSMAQRNHDNAKAEYLQQAVKQLEEVMQSDRNIAAEAGICYDPAVLGPINAAQ